MSTITMHATTIATPEQYTAALTDFGPGRSEIFGNSDDGYLKVHEQRPGHADVTEGSGGVWERCRTTGPTRTTSSPDNRLEHLGRPLRPQVPVPPQCQWHHRDRLRRGARGKNVKGHFLGFVLGTVGKSRLVKAFRNSVKAVEARDDPEHVAAMKLLRNVAIGAVAGAVGTAAMDLLLYARFDTTAARSASGVGNSRGT